MTFVTLPDFQNGDLLSASRLNQVLDNIDVLIGLDEQRQPVYDSGADVYGWNGNLLPWCRDRGYPAQAGKQVSLWLAHNGDTLKVYHGGVGTPTAANLWYDYGGTNQQGPIVVQPSAERTIAIPNAGLFYQYQPVRVFIQQADPNAAAALYMRYLYAVDSNAPSISGLPTFPNGDTSSAGDLNAILRACEDGLANLNQPVPCQLFMANIPAWTPSGDGGDKGGITGWFRYTHNTLSADMTIQGPQGSSPNYTDTATWYVNDVQVWQIELRSDGTPNGPTRYNKWDKRIYINLTDAGLSLTPGAWYKVEFVYHRSIAGPTGQDRGQRVTVWDHHFLPTTRFGTIDELVRWQHGDPALGDDGDNPLLFDMYSRLTTLNDNLRWYNQPCRAASSFQSISMSEEAIDPMQAYRVHRWLAYENFVKSDESRAPAAIHWASGNRTLQSYTLPTVEVPSFFDLESTPIKPGMYFKLTGAKFGIQTPQPGVNYA